MSRWALILLAVGLAVPGAALADPLPQGIVRPRVPPGTPLVEQGYQLYAGNCSSCHGTRGLGVRTPTRSASDEIGQGPPLRGVGALAADFYLRTGYMPLARVGIQPHRSHILFDERELQALVAYVASLGKGPAIPHPHPERGSVSEGQRLFAENCAGCHQIAAEGGYITGAVAPQLLHATPVQIAEAVRIGPYVMPTFSRRQISDRLLNSIITYVQEAKHPDDRGGWGLGHIGPVPEGLVTWLLAAASLVAVGVVIGKRVES